MPENFINILKDTLHSGQTIYLRLKVRPGASKTIIKNVLADGTIKLNVKAMAERGKANTEIIDFLAKELAVSPKSVTIVAGQRDRLKLVRIVKF